MSKFSTQVRGFVFAMAFGGLALQASAAFIYDNTTVPYYISGNRATFVPDVVSGYSREIGDQISPVGTDGNLYKFSFEYFGTFGSSLETCIRFYYNDGAPAPYVPSPSTSFYDSGWFNIPQAPLGGNVYYGVDYGDWSLNSLTVPLTNFTWTVQFRNIQSGDTVGVVLGDPTIGSSYDDYWTDTTGSGGWLLQTNSLVPMNFVARLETVPEPTAATILLASALGALALRAYRRKQ